MEKELLIIFDALLDWKVFVLILVYIVRPIIIKWIEESKYNNNLQSIDAKLTKMNEEMGGIKGIISHIQTPIKLDADNNLSLVKYLIESEEIDTSLKNDCARLLFENFSTKKDVEQ